jgi:hypothetical protein
MAEDSQSNSNLKPYYVYELVDSLNNEVFYVGKGLGQRGNQHEMEARRDESDSNKVQRIRSIHAAGGEVIVRVIGRYDTEDKAFAVEATLIHWVHGLANLANVQAGHGSSTIRDHGNISTIEGIDIPASSRQPDGVYTQSMKKAREEHGIVDFMQNIRRWLEQELDTGFTAPDTSESNKTKIYSYFENARIRVGAFHSKEPTLWLALEPTDNTPSARERFLSACRHANLEVRQNKKLARFPSYRGTKDLSVLLADTRKMIRLIGG